MATSNIASDFEAARRRLEAVPVSKRDLDWAHQLIENFVDRLSVAAYAHGFSVTEVSQLRSSSLRNSTGLAPDGRWTQKRMRVGAWVSDDLVPSVLIANRPARLKELTNESGAVDTAFLIEDGNVAKILRLLERTTSEFDTTTGALVVFEMQRRRAAQRFFNLSQSLLDGNALQAAAMSAPKDAHEFVRHLFVGNRAEPGLLRCARAVDVSKVNFQRLIKDRYTMRKKSGTYLASEATETVALVNWLVELAISPRGWEPDSEPAFTKALKFLATGDKSWQQAVKAGKVGNNKDLSGRIEKRAAKLKALPNDPLAVEHYARQHLGHMFVEFEREGGIAIAARALFLESVDINHVAHLREFEISTKRWAHYTGDYELPVEALWQGEQPLHPNESPFLVDAGAMDGNGKHTSKDDLLERTAPLLDANGLTVQLLANMPHEIR